MKYVVKVNGKMFDVEVDRYGGMPMMAPVYQPQAAPAPVFVPQAAPVPMQAAPAPQAAAAPAVQEAPAAAPAPEASSGQDVEVTCPMPGTVMSIPVDIGQSVAAGEVVVVVEAMKMENDIVAPSAGTVKQILVSKGTSVDTDDVLVVLQ